MQIVIDLPNEIQVSESDLHTEVAIALFQQQRITLGTASQIAGLHQIEFQRLADGTESIAGHSRLPQLKR
ncbi:MAG TPA: UPF0175 family protein [Elainellaceae cyanobacterium]|jgi:predicted HTH domain antitoxin